MPLKWIILGAFIAGLTVANIVTAARNNSTSGCDFLGANNSTNTNDTSTGRTQSNTNESAPAENSNTGDTGTDTTSNENAATENANVDGGSSTNDNSGDAGQNDNSNSAPANQNTNDTQANSNTSANSNTNTNTNQNSNDTSAAITGQFAGTLQRANAQSLGGDLPAPRITSSSQAMEFAANFSPVFIMTLNYAGAPDRPLTNVQRGNTQTLNATLGTKQITLDVTVREASYQRRQMHAVLDINYRSTSGNLTETGTGVQTIDCALDANGNLTISSAVHYEVRLSAGGIVFNTIEETSLTGTLNRE